VSDLAEKYGNFPVPVNSLWGLKLSCAISGSGTCGWKRLENERKGLWGGVNLSLLQSIEAKA